MKIIQMTMHLIALVAFTFVLSAPSSAADYP